MLHYNDYFKKLVLNGTKYTNLVFMHYFSKGLALDKWKGQSLLLLKPTRIVLMTGDVPVLLLWGGWFIFQLNELAAAVRGSPLKAWFGLAWPILSGYGGLSISFPLLVIKLSPAFSMPRLLDPRHRRGDLVSTTRRWIKGKLAMVVRGKKGQMGLRMQQRGDRECAVFLWQHLLRKMIQFV